MKKIRPPRKRKAIIKPEVKADKGKMPDKKRPADTPGALGLDRLKAPAGARKKRKLLGRGTGSGHGKTSGRGHKGQGSRAGRDFYAGFEGGQTPLIRKIPKRGFSNIRFKKNYQIVNIKDLAKIKEAAVDPSVLHRCGLIKNKDRLTKILGEGGPLPKPVIVKAHAFSRRAIELIEKSGGKAQMLGQDV